MTTWSKAWSGEDDIELRSLSWYWLEDTDSCRKRDESVEAVD